MLDYNRPIWRVDDLAFNLHSSEPQQTDTALAAMDDSFPHSRRIPEQFPPPALTKQLQHAIEQGNFNECLFAHLDPSLDTPIWNPPERVYWGAIHLLCAHIENGYAYLLGRLGVNDFIDKPIEERRNDIQHNLYFYIAECLALGIIEINSTDELPPTLIKLLK